MANSKYEYVKGFEQNDSLLPQTWIVIQVDGRGFTRFSQAHAFKKPNDMQALFLMNDCAKAVLEDISDVVFCYGVSDEYRSSLLWMSEFCNTSWYWCVCVHRYMCVKSQTRLLNLVIAEAVHTTAPTVCSFWLPVGISNIHLSQALLRYFYSTDQFLSMLRLCRSWFP